MNRLIVFLISFCCLFSAKAQPNDFSANVSKPKSEYIPVTQFWREHNIFQHLDASLTLGTTGIGLDVSSPITDMFQLRAGFSFMPRFNRTMNFGVQVGDNPSQSAAKFETLSSFMQNTMGYKIDNSVDMIGEPTYYNFSLLFDVFPFRQSKNWHFTAGFYWGNSKIATAVNATENMPSLVGVSIYNYMYGKAINREPFFVVNMNGGTYAYTEDPELQDIFYDRFSNYGRMGVHMGDYVSDDSPYFIEPNENSMVKAEVRANSFKPYLGFGYGGRLIKGDDRYKISFDCGVLFWGGTPSVITHDGTDLANDVKNIGGKAGAYIDVIKVFKVFPVLSVRFTRKLF